MSKITAEEAYEAYQAIHRVTVEVSGHLTKIRGYIVQELNRPKTGAIQVERDASGAISRVVELDDKMQIIRVIAEVKNYDDIARSTR